MKRTLNFILGIRTNTPNILREGIHYVKLGPHKYRLLRECRFRVKKSLGTARTEHVTLEDGVLTLHVGFEWDGPSGPAIDTDDFMRGAGGHDALYRLIRLMLIAYKHRGYADRMLVRWCKEDGMSWPRRLWVYAGVALFASWAAKPAT